MIILHKKKIIIFHNRKTSGTSFSLLMSPIASNGDFFPFYSGQLLVKKRILKRFKFNKYQRFSDIKFFITFKNLTYNFLLFFVKKFNKKNIKKIIIGHHIFIIKTGTTCIQRRENLKKI